MSDAASRAWHQRHPEYEKARSKRRWAASDREVERAKSAAYYLAHSEEICRRAADWYRQHPEQVKATREDWHQRNPAKVRAIKAAWKVRNPDHQRADKQNRRARLAAVGGSFTAQDWNDLLASFDFCCGYCGRSDVALEADHRTPISRGGRGDIANIIPACGRCNGRKGAKTEAEFRAASTPAPAPAVTATG